MITDQSPRQGRPSKYSENYGALAEHAIALGATRADLAAMFGVASSTLHSWLTEFPEFSESIKRAEVSRSVRPYGARSPELMAFLEATTAALVPESRGEGAEALPELSEGCRPESQDLADEEMQAPPGTEPVERLPTTANREVTALPRTEADAQRELAALRNELATIGAEYDDAALTAQRTGEDAAVATVERLTARRAMLEGAVRAVERELPTLRAQDQARARAALEQEFAAAKDAAKQIVTQEAEAWQALYGAWLRVVALKPPLEELQAARGHVLFPFFRDGPNRLGSVAGLSLSVLPDALIQALHQWDGRTTENWAGSIDYSAKRLCEQIDRLALPPTATGPARSYVEVMKDLTPVRSSFGVAVT